MNKQERYKRQIQIIKMRTDEWTLQEIANWLIFFQRKS